MACQLPSHEPRALPRAYNFATADKIQDLYTRFGTSGMAEDKAAVEYAIRTGRGMVELTLGEEQYRVLQMVKAPPRGVGS